MLKYFGLFLVALFVFTFASQDNEFAEFDRDPDAMEDETEVEDVNEEENDEIIPGNLDSPLFGSIKKF